MPNDLITTLRDRRHNVWEQAKDLADKAADENRHFSAREQEHWTFLRAELDALDESISRIDKGEQRAQAAAGAYDALAGLPAAAGAPRSLSAVDKELDQAFRSAILEKNPAPIVVHPDQTQAPWQPGLQYRDLTKGTATQALPVSVYNRVVMHLVESSAVLAAGATVLNTDSGEVLQVPKSTAFVTSAITAEGVSITESDPTLGKVDLGAYKYSSFFQISSELATDSRSDLLGFLAKQAAVSLASAFGPHLVTGDGSAKPRGLITDSTLGVTGPSGTGTSFGAQGTAGQGTDLLNDLYSSLAEPYTRSPSLAWLMRTPTLGAIRKLKATTGELVGNQFAGPPSVPGAQATMLGAGVFLDPSMAAMANTAKSTVLADMARYFVRIAGGLRFERSDDYAFQSDLISFRTLIRLDAALVDTTGASKYFVHTT